MTNPFSPNRVRVWFGNHFSIDLEFGDATRLVEALRSVIEDDGSV